MTPWIPLAPEPDSLTIEEILSCVVIGLSISHLAWNLVAWLVWS